MVNSEVQGGIGGRRGSDVGRARSGVVGDAVGGSHLVVVGWRVECVRCLRVCCSLVIYCMFPRHRVVYHMILLFLFGDHVTIFLITPCFAIMTHLQGVPSLCSSKSACSLTLVAAFVLLDFGRYPLSDPSGKTV